MKALLLSVFAIALSFGAFAQDSSMNQMHQNKMNMKGHEGIMMKNGQVMVIDNGKSTALTQDKTLSNGTVVSVNGTVKSSDGTITTLKDGDWVNTDGTIAHRDWKNKSKMKSNMNSSDSLK